MLERISRSAKLHLVSVEGGERTRPALPGVLAPVAKTLLLSTDDHRDIAPDLEGVAMLSESELLMVTDNDFGVDGAATAFYRVSFDGPLA